MKHRIVISFLIAICAIVSIAQSPSSQDINRKKRDTQKDINETTSKINENKRNTNRSLNDLNRTIAEIAEKEQNINILLLQIADINVKIDNLNAKIAVQDSSLNRLRSNYLQAIRSIRSHKVSGNKMMFLLSSASFHQAYRRVRYLKEFSRWREAQTRQIKVAIEELNRQKAELITLQNEKNETYNTINQNKLLLEGKRAEQNRIIAELKTEKTELEGILREQQRRLNALDAELNRIIEEERRAEEERARQEEERRRLEEEERARIAEEARRAEEERLRQEQEAREAEIARLQEEQAREAERSRREQLRREQEEIEREQERIRLEQERINNEREEERRRGEERRRHPDITDETIRLTGDFESNKGKLPMPVSGQSRIVKQFGRYKHPVLEYVTIDSQGVDIEASASATPRAVFDGIVARVYKTDNEFNYVVLLKHGSYITVYAGLKSVTVQKGEKVKAGQSLGSLFPDINDDSIAILHFQVIKGSTRLNPKDWLK